MFNLGKAIKTLKVQCELTNEQLAYIADKNHATVSAWINGHQSPSLSEMANICVKCDVKFSTFIKWGE